MNARVYRLLTQFPDWPADVIALIEEYVPHAVGGAGAIQFDDGSSSFSGDQLATLDGQGGLTLSTTSDSAKPFINLLNDGAGGKHYSIGSTNNDSCEGAGLLSVYNSTDGGWPMTLSSDQMELQGNLNVNGGVINLPFVNGAYAGVPPQIISDNYGDASFTGISLMCAAAYALNWKNGVLRMSGPSGELWHGVDADLRTYRSDVSTLSLDNGYGGPAVLAVNSITLDGVNRSTWPGAGTNNPGGSDDDIQVASGGTFVGGRGTLDSNGNATLPGYLLINTTYLEEYDSSMFLGGALDDPGDYSGIWVNQDTPRTYNAVFLGSNTTTVVRGPTDVYLQIADDTTKKAHLDSDGNFSIIQGLSTSSGSVTVDGTTGLLSGTYTFMLGCIVSGTLTVSYTSTYTTDCYTGNQFNITLSGDLFLANPINPTDGQGIMWRFLQDLAGGWTVTADSKFRDPSNAFGGLAMIASKAEYVSAIYDAADDMWDVMPLLGVQY